MYLSHGAKSHFMVKARVAACQMDSQDDKNTNIETAIKLLDEAGAAGVDFVALPEMFTFMGAKEEYRANAETIPGEVTERLGEKAQEYSMYVHGGSMFEVADEDEKVYNTTVVFNRDGELQATYRKIHLFDVEIGDEVVTQESAYVNSGDSLTVVETDFVPVGLSICYDLRFPELFSTLSQRGAEVIVLPAAFTLYTGKDHWETLLQARAIENQVYIIAPGQIGDKPSSVATYGRSLVVDPWGNVVSKASDTNCVVTADLDFDYLASVRQELPSLKHKQFNVYDLSAD
jgi:predicted amidohydrolase